MTLAPARLQQLFDRHVLVLDEGLSQQGNFRKVLAQAAFHHFGDDLGRLLFALGLLRQDFALLLQQLGRHIADVDIGRVHGRDVHRDIARQRFIAALQCRDAADSGAVDVGAQRARGGDAHEAAHRHVLPDLGDQGTALLVQARAIVG